MKKFDPDAAMTLSFNDAETKVNRYNSTIFMHLGELTMYDHIFIVTDDGPEMGNFIFRHNSAFNRIAKFMVKNLFPCNLNIPVVADCDKRAFDLSVDAMLGDTEWVPEGWEEATDGEA